MTWLTPALGALAAAVAVPLLLLLYMLRLRRREVEVSSTLLWKQTVHDVQANAPFQRLRRNLLLFLQLLAIAGLCAGLAQPGLRMQRSTGERHVIVIDRSASMQATDGDRPRLARAKETARRLVDQHLAPARWWRGLTPGAAQEQAMIVAFDVIGEVVQPFTSDRSALKAAIDAIAPADTPTRIEEAVGLIRAYAPRRQITETQPDGTVRVYDRPGGRVGTIHLISDGNIPDLPNAQFGPEDTVLYYPVGSDPAPNVAITGVQARRSFNDPDRISVFVSLQNTDTRPRRIDATIAFERADLPPMTQEVLVPPASAPQGAPEADADARPVPGRAGVVFRLTDARETVATVRIAPAQGQGPAADVLPLDDAASIVIPAARRPRVAVVSDGNFFLSRALDALPIQREPQAIPPERFTGLDPARYDVVVLDRWVPDPLPPGRYLVLGAVPPGSGIIDRKVESQTVARIADWKRDHPVLRDLSLDNLHLFDPRTVSIEPDAPSTTLALSTNGPAIVESDTPAYQAITVVFDPLSSDWGLDVSWVVFLGSSIRYLTERDAGATGPAVQPGETLTTRLPPDARDPLLRTPDGRTVPLEPAPDGTVTAGPFRTVGVHAIEWTGSPGPGDRAVGSRAVRPVACNLMDPDESDPAVRTEIASRNTTLSAQRTDGAQEPRELWPWALLAALGVMLLEWWVYNRRVYL